MTDSVLIKSFKDKSQALKFIKTTFKLCKDDGENDIINYYIKLSNNEKNDIKHKIKQINDNILSNTKPKLFQLLDLNLPVNQLQIILKTYITLSTNSVCSGLAKNPYTNLPWNAGQLASLMSQVGSLLWSAQKIVPEELSHFRDVCYDINLFLKENRRSLNISAAIDFLKNKDDEDARSICHELVTDLYNENYDVEKPTGWRSVRALVVARQLPTPMLRKWDAVVIGVWVYQNHGFSLGFKAYEDILEIFQRLHNQTYQWWQSRPVAAPQQVPNASQ
jgi:hypothetical protein